MGRTVVEKIVQSHLKPGPARRPVHAGDFVTLRPRHVMTHDNTSAVMKKFSSLGVARMHDARIPIFCIDHDIQNRTQENLSKYSAIETFAREQGIAFYPAGSGIGHQIVMEQLHALPGDLVVAADSHANMYGAIGALGTPVVRTDAAGIWATGEFWWQVPRTVQVTLEGALPEGATGKDVIVVLCGLYPHDVLGAAVEFAGAGIASLSMDERMAIANMTTEWGALAGWFPVDATTLGYVRDRRALLASRGIARASDAELESWERKPARPDPDASYAARITLDLSRVSPHVSGPDTVQVATPLAQLARSHIAIQKAYLVSCVNSRLADLEAAARVLRGARVGPGVELYVSAASREVQEAAERSGAWGALLDAGARPLPSGCGPCIGLGVGLLEPGEVGISATNRNFKGRMGSRDAQCYLASPEVVAASAVAGFITGPRPSSGARPERRIEDLEAPAPARERVEILPGFPERIAGRVLFLPRDHLDTDGIYGKDALYRDDTTRERMAQLVFANYDPALAARARWGDVIVGGFDFGSGSSREQAVTALQAKGIALVAAGSFSATYLRNAFNNGLPCIEVPDLVRLLRNRFASEIAAGTKSIVPGDDLEVDFGTATAHFRGESFRFAPLGSVPQELIAAGGLESRIRADLARKETRA